MDLAQLDRLRSRRLSRGLTIGRRSYRARAARFRAKRWQVAQCAVAAAVAWLVAKHALGHDVPVFAPIAAVLALGTSYGQRLRRVAEITVGVAVGVLLADLLVAVLGTGAWQLGLIVALAMTVGILLDGGTLLVNQAAIQSIFVVALLPGAGFGLTRWTDALVGGAVALVAATVVPAAALRRPREQAAVVLRKQSRLLRGVAEVLRDGDAALGAELLEEARSTEPLIRELEDAAEEGMAVVTSSPFRVRHRPSVRRMSDLVVPLDRSMRSCRVLVRQAAVAAHRRRDGRGAGRGAAAGRGPPRPALGGPRDRRGGAQRRDDRRHGARPAAGHRGRPADDHRDGGDGGLRRPAPAAAPALSEAGRPAHSESRSSWTTESTTATRSPSVRAATARWRW